MRKFQPALLRQAINQAGLSVRGLSQAAGIDRPHIYRYLNHGAEPSANSLAKLAHATAVSIDYFFADDVAFTHQGAPDGPAA